MGKIKTIGILTSGGDSPGMNAAIRAVTRSGIYNGFNIKGIYRGYEGLMNGEVKTFTTEDVSGIITRGGTILKSARSKDFMTVEGRQKAYETCLKEEIDALVVIGGNGSLTGAWNFGVEFDFPCIGLPGTIDNDISGSDKGLAKIFSNAKRQLDKMQFEVELEAGRLNGVPQVLSDSQDPNFSSRNFDAEELRALTGLHRTVMKDSIEGAGFMNTLTQRFAVANGLALERVLLYGNKSSNENVKSGYKVVDGICKKLSDDADINNETIDLTAEDSNPLQEIYRFFDLFPDEYKVDGGMACFAPSKLVRSVRRYILGNHYMFNIDASITQDGIPVIEDVPLLSVPQFSTPCNGFTKKPVILTHKENIQWLADPEDIIVESAFNLRANTWDVASTMYDDINFAQEDASALAWLKEA